MTLNNTGNSVPSTAFKDFEDNVKVYDLLLNDTSESIKGRTGKDLVPWLAMQNKFSKVITSLDTASFTFSDITTGLNGTTDGQYFRVPQGLGKGFTYYRNMLVNSVATAVEVASLASSDDVINASSNILTTLGLADSVMLNANAFIKGRSYDVAGNPVTTLRNYAATDLLPVNKGDCFIIQTPSDLQNMVNSVVLFNENKEFVGFLGKANPSQYLYGFNKGYQDREDYKGKSQIYRTPVRIPQNGYVAFQQTYDIYADTAKCFGTFMVRKVSWDTFVKEAVVLNSGVDLQPFKNILFSAVIGIDSVSATINVQTVGMPLVTKTDGNTFLTKPVAVNAGQYIHAMCTSFSTRPPLIFTDADDNYLGQARYVEDVGYMICSDSVEKHIGFNILSPFTGFVRMEVDSTVGYFITLAVTNVKVAKIKRNYVKSGDRLETLDSAGWFTDTAPTNMYGTATLPFVSTVVQSLMTVNALNKTTYNNKAVTFKPVLLRAGDVMVYRIPRGQSPLVGFAYPLGGMLLMAGAANTTRCSYLMAPPAYPIEQYNANYRAGYAPGVWWSPTNAAEVHFTNPEADMVVFLNGNCDAPQEYILEVFSDRNQYKNYRDTVSIPRMQFGGGTSNASGLTLAYNQASSNWLITFEDEYAQATKLGTWWQHKAVLPAIDGTAATQLFSSVPSVTITVTPPYAANAYDAPVDGVGFTYMAGIDTDARYVNATATLSAMVPGVDPTGAPNTTPVLLPCDNILKSFPVKIVSKRGNQGSALVRAVVPRYPTHAVNAQAGQPLTLLGAADTKTQIIPVAKGNMYKVAHSVWWTPSSYFYFWNMETGVISYPDCVDSSGSFYTAVAYQGVEHYYKAPSDGYLIAASIDSTTVNAADKLAIARAKNNYQMYCQQLTEDEYNRLAVPTKKAFENIPLVPGLSLNIVNGYLPTDTSKVKTTYGIAQLLLGDSILFVGAIEMSISGTGTATDLKKGYNFKFANFDGSKLRVKAGNMNASHKLSIKGYYVEGTQTRDSGSADLWRFIRKQSSNFIGQASLLSRSDLPQSFMELPFSTQGYPMDVYIGGVFLGVHTLRSRANPEDYLLDDSNSNMISMGPDYGNHMAYASWANYDQTYWTVNSPDMKGYNDGDATIPDAKVAAHITRFTDWISQVVADKSIVASTIGQYLDVPSWVDYFLHAELVGNNDGIRNNVSVVTWEGKIWSLCAYDMDRTMGLNYAGSKLAYDRSIIRQDAFLNNILEVIQPQITAKYKALRAAGLISQDGVFKFYSKYANVVSSYSYAQDNKMWGTMAQDYQTTAFMYNWIAQRIAWLDTKWV